MDGLGQFMYKFEVRILNKNNQSDYIPQVDIGYTNLTGSE